MDRNEFYKYRLVIKRDYGLIIKSPYIPRQTGIVKKFGSTHIEENSSIEYYKQLDQWDFDKEKAYRQILTKNEHKDNSSVYKTRAKIRELLDMNLNPQSRFITLTYKNNMMDYKQATKDFNKMLNSINKRKLPEDKLKYLQVKEHQKRGAIHYHIITFNMEHLDFSKYWPHGSVHHKEIEYFDSGRIANYFTSYLTKEKTDYKKIEKGVRIFGYSNNLQKYQKGKVLFNSIKDLKSLMLKYNDYWDTTVSVINLQDAQKIIKEKENEII